MRNQTILLATTALAMLLLSACTLMTTPEGDNPGDDPPDDPVQNANDICPAMVIFDLSVHDFRDDATVQRYAKADILIMNDYNTWGGSYSSGSVALLKAANPEIKILNYTRSMSAPATYPESGVDRDAHPYYWDWWHATREHWCWTTEGDTAFTWPDEVILNILNPDCRAAIIGVIAQHQNSQSNRVDGAFWDFFCPTLWIAPQVLDVMQGEPDMDGDGIGHFEDEDEQAAFRDASSAFVLEVRAALGDDFIQIFNGTRAHRDSVFAALGDGFMYERFPRMFGNQDNMITALDPGCYYNVFAARHWPRTRNGGPYVLMANKAAVGFMDHKGDYYRYNLGDINRVVALLVDNPVVYTGDTRWIYGWPEVELRLGTPLGGISRDGDTISRQFENGSVTLTMTTGTYPFPFSFEIVQDGEIVQSLNAPYHFP